MANVCFFNCVSNRDAQLLKHFLTGMTYMKFSVEIAPFNGSFNVLVSTGRPDTTEEELKDMLMQVVAGEMLSYLRKENCDRANR